MSTPVPEVTTYTTPDLVKKAAAPDGNTAGTAATLEDNQLQELIVEAQGTVNGYVGTRYKLPFKQPYPQMLVSLSTAVALYFATLTYRRNKDLDPNDPVVLRYKHALSLLTAISAGKAKLVNDDGGEIETEGEDAPPSSDDSITVNPYEGNLFGYEVGAALRPSQRYPRW